MNEHADAPITQPEPNTLGNALRRVISRTPRSARAAKAVILSPELREMLAQRASLQQDIRGMYYSLSEREITPERETLLKASIAECEADAAKRDARISHLLSAIDRAVE